MSKMYGKFLKPFVWIKTKIKNKNKNNFKIITEEFTMPGSHGGRTRIFGSGYFYGWDDLGDFSINNTRLCSHDRDDIIENMKITKEMYKKMEYCKNGVEMNIF